MLVLVTLALPSAAALPPAGQGGSRDDWTWTLIDEKGLALGGGGLSPEDLEYVHAEGFRAVLNYREEMPADEATLDQLGLEYLFLPNTYAEEDTMPLAHVQEAVRFIEENLAAGRPVYVHCTGGWHRSAVGVVAYYMKTNGWRYEEAWEHVASLRPGIEARYADALLEYEAHLFEEPKLTLDLTTERWDVEVGESVGVTAYVTLHGAPVGGAKVRFDVEHRKTTQEGTTDAEGRARFTMVVPDVEKMQYVQAWASKDGHIDGYDRNVYWIKVSRVAPPTEGVWPEEVLHAQPGAEVRVPFEMKAGGKPTNARVTLTSTCATHFREYTGWDGRVDALFRAPEQAGEYTLRVHVHRFPAEPVFGELRLVVGEGGPEPGCGAARAPEDESVAVDTPGAAGRAVPTPWLAAVVALGAAAAWSRRR